MKLVQDSSQTKAAAALLGAGFPTPGETGSTSKKLAFAEDLRQQISDAVAGSRTRQHTTNPQPAVSPPSNTGGAVNTQSLPLKTMPDTTSDLIDDKNAEGIAAGGMLLPLPDQTLPIDPHESNSTLHYTGTLPGEFGTEALTFDVDGLPSIFDIVPSGATVIDALPLQVASEALTPVSFAPQLRGEAWQPLPVEPAPAGLSGWSTTDATASALAALLPVNPAVGINEIPETSEFRPAGTLPAAFSIEQLATNIDSTKPGMFEDATMFEAELPGTQPATPRAGIEHDVAAINLTPAYDLALPDVMPSSAFDTLSLRAPQIPGQTQTAENGQPAIPLSAAQLIGAAPLLNNEQTSAVDNISTQNIQTPIAAAVSAANTSTSLLQQQVDTAEQLAVSDLDLQTKGLEPASSSSTRSAFVSNLLANLLGTNSDITAPPGNTAPPPSAVTSMEGMFEHSSGLIPTKSVTSDQQLLASVGASASESASSLQGASLYHADQRLQQAAEARLAHLQGLQQTGTSGDNPASRMTSTGLSGLDVTFGQPGWVERVGRQMLLQSAQGNSSAQIQLDPPELGSLTIRIQLVEQTATVNFVSPHAMVRDALEQQAQRLQEMFNEQGMNLRDVSVSDQSNNGRQQSDRQSDGQQGSPAQAIDSKEQTLASSVQKSVSLIDYYA